jgi:hypothetical protein
MLSDIMAMGRSSKNVLPQHDTEKQSLEGGKHKSSYPTAFAQLCQGRDWECTKHSCPATRRSPRRYRTVRLPMKNHKMSTIKRRMELVESKNWGATLE